MPTPIINQQLEDLKDSMDDIKDAIENLPFAGVPEAVADWLDDHPEATTTVQDGSITKAKLATSLKDYKKYVTRLFDADAAGTGGNSISVGCDVDVNDEVLITIYQTDTQTSGSSWSDGNVSYLTFRDTINTAGYIYPFPNNGYTLMGNKQVIYRIRRIPNALISEIIIAGEPIQMNIVPRETTYTDHISWVALSAGTGKVIKKDTLVTVLVRSIV